MTSNGMVKSITMRAADERSAGFWIRLMAVWLDAALVGAFLGLVIRLVVALGFYLPFELSLLILGVAYSAAGLTWKGQTPGKRACGLIVCQKKPDGKRPIGFRRALFRESIGKFASCLPLFAGFIWIGFSRSKRGLHDRLARTIVLRTDVSRLRRLLLGGVIFTGSFLAMAPLVCRCANYYALAKEMMPLPDAAERWANRSIDSLIQVSSVSTEAEPYFIEWIQQNGMDPVDYAVKSATKYRVTLFGELHGKKSALSLLNRMIPELYHRAGVTCIAMEVCLAKDNDIIHRLVTGATYDDELALTIARRQPTGLWGYYGYWQVFRTVWQLNQTLFADQPPMRVIGLDAAMDMPSVMMMDLENTSGREFPWWEKLRAWRLIYTLPDVLMRDVLMARQIEQEIILRGERGIVWIGANHSPIHCRQAVSPNRAMARLGFILHQKYPDKVFQIRLHGSLLPAHFASQTEESLDTPVTVFLERVLARSGGRPLGFDIIGSPFDLLHDDELLDGQYQPCLSLGDLAGGYIYLNPWRDDVSCDWIPGYVTRSMFVANKPFYQAFGRQAGRELQTADDVNVFFAALEH